MTCFNSSVFQFLCLYNGLMIMPISSGGWEDWKGQSMQKAQNCQCPWELAVGSIDREVRSARKDTCPTCGGQGRNLERNLLPCEFYEVTKREPGKEGQGGKSLSIGNTIGQIPRPNSSYSEWGRPTKSPSNKPKQPACQLSTALAVVRTGNNNCSAPGMRPIGGTFRLQLELNKWFSEKRYSISSLTPCQSKTWWG